MPDSINNNPVLVNVWRGSTIESRHTGAVAVVSADGRTLFSLGDVARPLFPRSAIKLLQAIPLVESGALERYGLDARHLALACASHSGGPLHVEVAQSGLERLGLTMQSLECGAELPMGSDEQFELIRSGMAPERLHHNCSGKHMGLLASSLAHGDDTRDYRLYRHPSQQRWMRVIEQLCGVRTQSAPWGYDGCGIPSLAIPLQRAALGMARFGLQAVTLGPYHSPARRIIDALQQHPELLAGEGRLCTAIVRSLGPAVYAKYGAEAVYTATLPEAGIGIALKIDDGQRRAAEVAIGAVLETLGLLDADARFTLGRWIRPDIHNSRGEVVGRVEPSGTWDELGVASDFLI